MRRLITNPTVKHNCSQLLARAEGDKQQVGLLVVVVVVGWGWGVGSVGSVERGIDVAVTLI